MRNIGFPDSLFFFRKFPVGREFAGRSTRAAGKGVREGAGGRYSGCEHAANAAKRNRPMLLAVDEVPPRGHPAALWTKTGAGRIFVKSDRPANRVPHVRPGCRLRAQRALPL